MLENEIPESLQQKLEDAALGILAEDECPDCKLLINMYLNDKNSSTARQLVTARICGYDNSFKKFGYDAIDELGNHKEIKPANKRKGQDKKHCGRFGFSDYTEERFGKDVHANVHILQSFFLDGRIMYIFEFPIIDLSERMELYIKTHIKEKKQRYIRSADFSFTNLKKENIIIKYISPNFEDCKDSISSRIYNFIKNKKV